MAFRKLFPHASHETRGPGRTSPPGTGSAAAGGGWGRPDREDLVLEVGGHLETSLAREVCFHGASDVFRPAPGVRNYETRPWVHVAEVRVGDDRELFE